ncbi:adhesin-like protein [Streptomyces laurentii]|uniref:Adhesin-like protein n=1 Tax=Streptomyces laurentii TaxID=39478 RepID=A0A169NVI9_STRLU|nr:adhesin-like protein [Streptomyces laurentii]
MPDRQSTNDNNPFAPPPEGRPDQPWKPRTSPGADGSGSAEAGGSEDGSPSGPGWSSSQPGRSSDGWGRRPDRPGDSGGPGGGPGGGSGGGPGGSGGGPGGSGGGPEGGQGPGLRWDPTDPAQRRARYAVLSGMWAFFFSFFVQEIALLLGALGAYWAISALRSRPKAPETPLSPAQTLAVATATRSKQVAAIGGLVASTVALMIVASSFAVHIAYRDFYQCRDDALTQQSRLACNDLLPKPLQNTFGVRE